MKKRWIEVHLSNFRVEELPHLGKGIVVDVEAEGKKGKITISMPQLAAAGLLHSTEPIHSVARSMLCKEVKDWAKEKGLVTEADIETKLLEQLIDKLKGLKVVEVGVSSWRMARAAF